MAYKITEFGKETYKYFQLNSDYIHTNHAAYGAIAKHVSQHAERQRQELQANPQEYYFSKLPQYIEENADALAEYLGVKGNSIAFTRSATESMNAVLRSLSLLAGDEIITDISIYPSTARVLDFVCGRAGARHVKVSPPVLIDSVDAFVTAYLNAITPRTRLIILEDVTSNTGLIQPIEQIIEECNRRGIFVLIDGAHAVGAVPRDLSKLNVDWYIGCLHKWLGVERGAGFIYASDKVKDDIRPMNISRNYYEPYPNNFDWPGTGDFSSWLTVKEAIAFKAQFDGAMLFEYCRDLMVWAGNYAAEEFGTSFTIAERFIGHIVPVLLPKTYQHKKIQAKDIMDALYKQGIMSKIEVTDNKKWLRMSAYMYNEEQDYIALVQAIKAMEADFSV